jgi:hypothetical protein
MLARRVDRRRQLHAGLAHRPKQAVHHDRRLARLKLWGARPATLAGCRDVGSFTSPVRTTESSDTTYAVGAVPLAAVSATACSSVSDLVHLPVVTAGSQFENAAVSADAEYEPEEVTTH